MLEKEAEKYASDYITCQEAYKDGAEFSYNKANEWHEIESKVTPKREDYKNQQLTKAKEIIKDYMIIAKSAHITVCGVSEENRTIDVLKLNEEAERFIREEEE